jgi:hypothetical protein
VAGIELIFFGLGVMLTKIGRKRDTKDDSHMH